MAYSVGLCFDSAAEAAIRSIWAEMARAGATPVAPYLFNSANRPHITTTLYQTINPGAACLRLDKVAAAHTRFPVYFQYLGIFPGPSPVVFLGPVVTRQLLEIQQAIDEALDNLGGPSDIFYKSDFWVPHCSLAMEMKADRLLEAITIAQHLPLPFDAEIQELDLIEFRPVRHLGTFTLPARINK